MPLSFINPGKKGFPLLRFAGRSFHKQVKNAFPSKNAGRSERILICNQQKCFVRIPSVHMLTSPLFQVSQSGTG